MHRTEGTNNVGNLFFNGPPGTVVEEDWLNAVQEEICYLIEQAGLTVLTAGTETRQQLKAAVAALIAVHAALTSTHGAVSAATADKIILRDAAGRAKVVDPSVASDIATKNTVDSHAVLTNAHSGTSAATADRLVLRNGSGRAQVAAPSDAGDIARKAEVDLVSNALTVHAALTNPHSATATPTASRVAMYDSSGRLNTNDPSGSNDCVAYGQFTRSFATSGYQCLPGGLILQWMHLIESTGVGDSKTFPIAFTSAVYSVQITPTDVGSNAGGTLVSYSLTEFVFKSGDQYNNNMPSFIFAVGV